jgi:spermidine/putrescine transport system substrate-binding protein
MSKRTSWFNRYSVSIARKMVIIGFYVALIVALLFLPRIIEYFQPSQTLNVCAFTETFCPEAIERFEKATGAKVNLTYVELDEQIYAKFKINQGTGYDVINVSDFMVHILAKQGFLHKLDHSLIRNMTRIDDVLLHRLYDPENKFCMPHKWFMYGLVYDKKFFGEHAGCMSLDFIFKNPNDLYKQGLVKELYKVCMLDSAIDSFFIAALYLFGRAQNFSDDDCKKIKQLLMRQKEWVECYTLYTVEYFLRTNIVPIALTSSNFMYKLAKTTDRFGFAVPKEGGIWVIENLVIPEKSEKKVLAHKFIDFMLSDSIAQLNSSWYGWASANKNVSVKNALPNEQISQILHNQNFCSRLYIPLFYSLMRTKIDDAWLEVGFA